jgi:hypothetical protein
VPTAAETADATAIPILEIGRAWMLDPGTAARGAELGLPPGFSFWVNGRAGALGPVDADVAAAALGFMAPDLVAEFWNGRPEDLGPRDAAAAYAEASHAWGRDAMVDMAEADLRRLAELSNRVVAAALPICGVLFAGWRVMPAPADPAGAATHALQVLREMRGGAHLSAIQAAGLTPQQAVISFVADPVRGGSAGAERFGWKAPHPEPDEEARAQAEVGTTNVCRHAFEALPDGERGELIELVLAARSAIGD